MILAAATAFLPPGNLLRLLIALPILLAVPGYLAIQGVIAPAAPSQRRLVHAFIGVGVSPAVVGLLALSTSMVGGAFRAAVIVAWVTFGSLVLAIVGSARRASHSHRHESAPTTRATVG